jgi:hypothetical protein
VQAEAPAAVCASVLMGPEAQQDCQATQAGAQLRRHLAVLQLQQRRRWLGLVESTQAPCNAGRAW